MRVPVTVLRPVGRVSVPKEAPMVAVTPRGPSRPGMREVSTRTFSWRSLSRRQAPWPSGTKVVMSLTNFVGRGQGELGDDGPVRADAAPAGGGAAGRSPFQVADVDGEHPAGPERGGHRGQRPV